MMQKTKSSHDAGFTLIELLVTIGILGILASLSFNNIGKYRASAGYSVAQTAVLQARTAIEASLSVPDAVYASFDIDQAAQGALQDSGAAAFLPEFQVSKNLHVFVSNDSTCMDSSCTAHSVTIRHCRGDRYLSWTRAGDGSEILLEDIPGAGC